MARGKGYAGPNYFKMMPHVLQILNDAGKPLTKNEIVRRMVDLMNIPDGVAAFPHDAKSPNGRTALDYDAAWSLTHLRKSGFVSNSNRTWAITEQGKAVLDGDPSEAVEAVKIRLAKESKDRKAARETPETPSGRDSHDAPSVDDETPASQEAPAFPGEVDAACFVGALIDGTDHTDEFLAEGLWRCDSNRYSEKINAVQVGTPIAIKAAFTRKNNLPFDNHGETVSVMRIKARGTVRHNPRDGHTLRVDWDKDYEPAEWFFFTLRPAFACVRRSLEDWKQGALLDFAFGDQTQDIEAFLSDIMWLGRYESIPEGREADLPEPARDTESSIPYTSDDFLNEVFMDAEDYRRLVALLERKRNIILQGAPGTGKTFAARRLAWSLMGCRADERIAFVQFHQNTSYEEMIVGYRPTGTGMFKLTNGQFTAFCDKARGKEGKFFFVIDEINRANVARVMGEMLVAMEKKHRNEMVSVRLEDGRNDFSVPDNVYIIGMMNTADRSLDSMDYALRRRFSFFDMKPAFGKASFLQRLSTLMPHDFAKRLDSIVLALNEKIADERGRSLRIGHSYFLETIDDEAMSEKEAQEWLSSIIAFELTPLLEQYWYDSMPRSIQEHLNDLRALAKMEP